jgi:hypothetical protein
VIPGYRLEREKLQKGHDDGQRLEAKLLLSAQEDRADSGERATRARTGSASEGPWVLHDDAGADSSLLQGQEGLFQIVGRSNLHFLQQHIQLRRTGIEERELIRREGVPENPHQSDSREYLLQDLQLLRPLLRGQRLASGPPAAIASTFCRTRSAAIAEISLESFGI